MFSFVESIKELKGNIMNELTTEKSMENGFKLLEQSMEHFIGIDDNEHAQVIANIIGSLLSLGKTILGVIK